jgi:hypothetical protein
VNIIDAALRDLDRKAGADRSAAAIRIARSVIAGSDIPAIKRSVLLATLEHELLKGGF